MNGIFTPLNVAVITGAASGIGRAAAIKCAEGGMRVALIDANAEKLDAAKAEIMAACPDPAVEPVLALDVDVSDHRAMQVVADRVIRQWGVPSFLMNNAAIHVHGGPGGILDPIENWQRVFDVNLFGILNGISVFLPAMLEAAKAGVIVNTGSKQGITHPPGNPAYNTAKAAVNAYTMNLARDVREKSDGRISAHLLVPGWTTTGDHEHKPGAWTARQVVDYMFDHLATGDFYIICPDDETTTEMDRKRILWQALDMIENRPALSRWHPEFGQAFADFMKKDLS